MVWTFFFTLDYPFYPLSPSLWETTRYRLKYCLKGPLNPKQPTESASIISNNRLSRRENLVLVLTQKSKTRLQNIVEKRRNYSSGAISPLFHNLFKYIFLTKGVKLHSHVWNLVVRIIFSSILQIWYVEVRISRSVLEGPFDFEITRVDCCI